MHEVNAAEAASRAYSERKERAATPARDVVDMLGGARIDAAALRVGKQYLAHQIELAARLDCDLPADPAQLVDWIEGRAQRVGEQYAQYLAQRSAGGPRRFFGSQAHALYFLATVAPTKLVDGAWLYGTLRCWKDPVARPLILTYLEELGDGLPAMNHVAMYRQLLARHDGDMHLPQADEFYVQPAIQLALGHHADELLPEAIGFNLGYEQLPLHLLITAYELNELGIDPYYFTLHVTIDNAASGHASKAAAAVVDAAAQYPDRQDFMRRLRHGYLLNELGASTMDIIEGFDLDQEVVRMLASKARYGSHMHSDYCRFGGKTVNQWLQDPASTADFLAELQKSRWIERGRAADESRFWRLIERAGGEMFGVFDGVEKQLLKDWIEHGWSDAPPVRSFRAAARLRERQAGIAPASGNGDVPPVAACPAGDLDALIADLSPGRHHTPAGLAATRAFSALYRCQ
ncbi:iron-containing redox enzyme family protein [Herbaspirillum seropedicae]|nr:iron-containing redox enzyme family protein [Herbaspirillum sp. alder98]